MRAVALLAVAGLIGGLAPAAWAGHARDEPQAYELLSMVRRGLEHPHSGEAVHLTWDEHGSRASLTMVHSGGGEVTVQSSERWTLRLSEEGGGLVDHARGWHVPFPDLEPAAEADPVAELREKYRASLGDEGTVAGMSCRVVELHKRVDERLRERLCIAEATGLLLRRETFGPDGSPVRLSAYLSIDVATIARARPRPARGRGAPAPVPLVQHNQDADPLDSDQLASLRRTGWIVPTDLPGGYRSLGGYSLQVDGDAPLHLVYRDGLYTVSLFQQPGRIDWDALPPGGQPARDLGWHAYEWPGALPHRLVWEADGFTYTLVGDAPPDEQRAIARTLPTPAEPAAGDRLRRGLSRLWRWLIGGGEG